MNGKITVTPRTMVQLCLLFSLLSLLVMPMLSPIPVVGGGEKGGNPLYATSGLDSPPALAVGAPNDNVYDALAAGAVNVLYGSSTGLSATGNQLWHQDSKWILGTADWNEEFGGALAAGDFNGDGHADLAVGVPEETVLSVPMAGAVNVLYGSAAGLSVSGNQWWHQTSPGILGSAEEGDEFGGALAAGDFNGDGHVDLAVGVPYEDVGSVERAGAVNILYGSAAGLSATGNQLWHQGLTDLWPGYVRALTKFGFALAAGDFNGDSHDDLAVGVPSADLFPVVEDVGAVVILYGSTAGLTATGNQGWHQDSPNILDWAEEYDDFGYALAAGYFDGDGYADLAVGVRLEDVDSVSAAGAVNVLYGSSAGLSATGNQFWHQDSPDIVGVVEAGDTFGSALAAGDFNGDERDDLAVGAPQEDVDSVSAAGAVNIVYGSAAGLSAYGNQVWHQDSPDILDVAETDDWFGAALAAGDLDDDGRADLAVGVEREDVGGVERAGAVNILYGSAAGLSATGNQVWHQDSPDILGVAGTVDNFGAALAVLRASQIEQDRAYLPLVLRNF
jgi:disulfide bond formation protein DsbB